MLALSRGRTAASFANCNKLLSVVTHRYIHSWPGGIRRIIAIVDHCSEHRMKEAYFVTLHHAAWLTAPGAIHGRGHRAFSHWLRRFNDHAEAHEKPWTDADKLRKLKAYLRGGPREKWDEFTDTEKASFVAATNKLKPLYENSFSKDIAKLNLVRCRQRTGESIGDFVERLRKLVKAATVGSTTDVFKERFLEEFLDRIDDDIGFHVKALIPNDMEEAVCQAMRFEGLLEARMLKRSAEDHVDQIATRVVAALNLRGKANGTTHSVP